MVFKELSYNITKKTEGKPNAKGSLSEQGF